MSNLYGPYIGSALASCCKLQNTPVTCILFYCLIFFWIFQIWVQMLNYFGPLELAFIIVFSQLHLMEVGWLVVLRPSQVKYPPPPPKILLVSLFLYLIQCIQSNFVHSEIFQSHQIQRSYKKIHHSLFMQECRFLIWYWLQQWLTE